MKLGEAGSLLVMECFEEHVGHVALREFELSLHANALIGMAEPASQDLAIGLT